MRKHQTKQIPQYGVLYRPLTIDPDDKDFIIESGILYKHQHDYVYLMAMYDSMNMNAFRAKIDCPHCGEEIKFELNRNHIMVDEFESNMFGKEIKLSIHPYITGKESIPELIDFVVIDGEQIFWDDCKDSEKEAVLDSIDYEVFKSIDTALKAPSVVANIPVRCSCGKDTIVGMRGLETFLRVVG